MPKQLQQAETLWAETLKQLKLQMTRATYESHLAQTWVVSADDHQVVIGVRSEMSQAWIEHRLAQTINRAAVEIWETKEIDLRFVISSEPDAVLDDPEPDGRDLSEILADDPAADYAQRTDFHAIKTAMGRWIHELQYDNLFWAPFLGRAWLLYRGLLMQWVKSLKGKGEMARLSMSDPAHHWTTPFRISYRELTQALGRKNHKTIAGGFYECHNSEIYRKVGQPISTCCGCHSPHDWQPDPDGGGRCRYWASGLIHQLYEANLLAIQISDTNRATIQVWRNLPLLTPHQVGQLNDHLQEEHKLWLKTWEEKFELPYDEWQRWRSASLMLQLPGWREYRELHGRPPENPLSTGFISE